MSNTANDVVIDYWKHNPKLENWFCWVYVQTDFNFGEWFEKNCPTGDCTFRFNSGNPVYIVTMTDEKEALLFQLKWKVNDHR